MHPSFGTSMRQISFGLDLAGYSSGGSALAKAETDDPEGIIDITLFQRSAFAACVTGKMLLSEVNKAELEELRFILNHGILVVDVCIDLQGLPNSPNPERIWQLTRRPVDRAFDALPPLADKIGAYVARMQRLMAGLGKEDLLGKRLFETYPAASLTMLQLENKKYKGIAKSQEGTWVGIPSKDKVGCARNNRLASHLNWLAWSAEEGFTITHDDFDASLCALAGIARPPHRLELNELKQEIAARLLNKRVIGTSAVVDLDPPSGYILLQSKFGNVRLHETNEELIDGK